MTAALFREYSLWGQVGLIVGAVVVLVAMAGFVSIVVTMLADLIIDLIRSVDTWRLDSLERRRQFRRQQQITDRALRLAEQQRKDLSPAQQKLRQDVRRVLEADQRKRLDMATKAGSRP